MQTNRVSFLRSKRIRATLLNAAAQPLVGDSSVVTTKGFVTLTMTSNTEEGEAINVVNASGETCISEAATPTWTGVAVEAEFCEVDFSLFEMLTGQEVVLDAAGRAIGITESTDVDLSAVKFALEMWMGASTTATPAAGSQGFYGYVLLPHLGGGVIGDVTLQNGAITFTVSGMQTKNGGNWGAGPHKVQLVGGVPAVLSTAMKANDHRRIMITEVAPPTVYSGATPLLNTADPAITDFTATATAPPTLSLGTTATTGGTFGAGAQFWKVTALVPGGESAGSNEVTATLVANGTQVLTWTAFAGATGYKVYRGTTAGGQSVLVATVGAVLTYTDTGTAGTAGTVPAGIRQVAFVPVPSGTSPMFYDFGDGTWDYTANGSYTKVYAAAGTYTVVAKRGLSSVSKSITV